MMDRWKDAWSEAVRNFRRELEGEAPFGDVAAADRLAAMRRDLREAEGELARVTAEIERTTRAHEDEIEARDRCLRQERMAREIDDHETADIAARFADRHGRRANVFSRKLEALQAEAELRRADVDEMRARLETTSREMRQSAGEATATPADVHTHRVDPLSDPTAEAFREMEEELRERDADARLQELKRRVR